MKNSTKHVSEMIKYLLLLFILTCNLSVLNGQSELERYYKKGLDYEMTNPDSAAHYFYLIDSLTEGSSDTLMRHEVCAFFGGYYYMKGEFDKTIKLYDSNKSYFRDTASLLTFYNNYATALEHLNVEKADSIYEYAARMAEKYKMESSDRATIYNNYGLLLSRQGEMEEAAHYLQLAIEHAPSPFRKFQSCISILNVFSIMENDVRMEEYIMKAVDLGDKENLKSRNGGIALYYAVLLLKKGKVEKAENELQKALEFKPFTNPQSYKVAQILTLRNFASFHKNWEKMDSFLKSDAKNIEKFGVADNPSVLLSQGMVAYHLNDFVNAERYTSRALQRSIEKKWKVSERNCHKLLGETYAKLGKYKLASEQTMIADKMAEEIYRNNQLQTINYLEAKHKRKEQDAAIENLSTINSANEVILTQQRQRLIGGGIALGLITFLSFFLFRLYKKVNNQKDVISKALSEKDILLREIHHRVKNNLQLVSSLLTLQSRSIEDSTALQAINEGKSRVRSMALIHQDLYNRENLTGLSVKEYVEKLSKELFSTYRIDNDRISLSMDVEDIELDVDTLVPLGLIINELITNSLKYAFPGEDKGILTISLKEKESQIHLIVKDNGIGYSVDDTRENSFGSTLISALTEQLGGERHISNGNGTEVLLIIDDYRKL